MFINLQIKICKYKRTLFRILKQTNLTLEGRGVRFNVNFVNVVFYLSRQRVFTTRASEI